MKRRGGKFGRHLATMPAGPFMAVMPAAMFRIVEGMELAASTRPYLTTAGRITVRLVFRRRDEADLSFVVTFTLGALTDELTELLRPALGPRMVLSGFPRHDGGDAAGA